MPGEEVQEDSGREEEVRGEGPIETIYAIIAIKLDTGLPTAKRSKFQKQERFEKEGASRVADAATKELIALKLKVAAERDHIQSLHDPEADQEALVNPLSPEIAAQHHDRDATTTGHDH